MKHNWIVQSTEKVQSILRGRKTQERKLLSEQPIFTKGIWHFSWGAGTSGDTMPCYEGWTTASHCPFGKVGDLIWVKETYCPDEVNWKYRFKANLSDFGLEFHKKQGRKWTSSHHMIEDHARIWLKITNVRLETLWKITTYDASSEGLEPIIGLNGQTLGYKNYLQKSEPLSPIASFLTRFDKENPKVKSMSNPWVWVIEFEVASTTGRP